MQPLAYISASSMLGIAAGPVASTHRRPAVPAPTSPGTNYASLILAQLRHHPAQPCLVWPAPDGSTSRHTGHDLLQRIAAHRQQLLTAGVQPGHPVLLAVPVSVELIAGLLAVQALGAVPVLPPAGASGWQLLHLTRRLSIGVVLTATAPRQLLRLVAGLLGVQLIAAEAGPLGAAIDGWEACPVPAQQPALVSHSSGSTGRPKAIRRSHAVLQAQHAAIKAAFPPWQGQRDFPLFPNVLLHNLAAGVVSVLPAVPWHDLRQLSPARLVAQLQDERVQTLTGNVAYFAALLAHLQRQPVALPDVVAVGVGGSPVPEPLAQQLRQAFGQAAVHVIYGSSEAEPIAVRQVTDDVPNPLAGYCVGTIQSGLEWRFELLGVLQGRATPGQPVGELWVRGAHVAATPGEWLRTGDYGYVADGQLYLTGRQGNEQLHHGVQHYQLEHLLYHLPGVERAAARADAAGFTVFVQGTVPPASVARLLAEQFPGVPVLAIHFRTMLPVDARHHSKILYSQLR
ncbi:class I adenylate-forming enzyme family protein [Hymenobacter canadensis]|uniref:AMP-binding protein n=1 Tax=Hymenobacter canadensis TaxID=2999067 RepID=A0ABY7LMF5_9BACT|nr:AMP-binding protein [Hymenobacter canadensis]WBA40375.1 AMP-binding protein [Hymenobacter canadensis]